MIDLKIATCKNGDMTPKPSNKCRNPDCIKYASFNIKGLPARFCNEHRTPNMVNAKKKVCAYVDCYKQPSTIATIWFWEINSKYF